MGRVGFGSDPASLRAAITDVEKRLRHARLKLEDLGPRIEAARGKADYLAKQYQERLGDYLNQPENARRLFDPNAPGEERGARGGDTGAAAGGMDRAARTTRFARSHSGQLPVAEHLSRLLPADPPAAVEKGAGLARGIQARRGHSEAVSRAAVFDAAHRRIVKEESARRPAKRCAPSRFALPRTSCASGAIPAITRRLTAAMERVNLVRNERTRELSDLNHSLYEFLLPEEARPAEDRVLSHTIIKADVRGSTKITQDLLARGLNPASLFSLNFYEPVKRILDRYGAAKVFIEGDALVLAIFETESNRAQQRAVSKACALARQILAVSFAYNERAESSDLPRLELGVGIAFQGSAPTYWMDTDSRIMISRALNLSDRLSSCSKAAKRLLSQNPSLFRLFLFQTMMEGVAEDEADEFLIRFNLNGVELNEEGFQKLQEEIALTSIEADCVMPWGKERVTFYAGETPVGEGIEPVLIRRGFVRQLLPDGKIGAAGARAYYEVCTSPKVFELVEYLNSTAAVHLD